MWILLKDKGDLQVGKFSVDSGKCVNLGLDIGLILVVQVYLHSPSSVNLHPRPLTDNLRGIDNIVQDGLVDGSEGARTRARCLAFRVSGVRLSENGPLGDNENMASRELLFEFPNKSGLDLVEGGEEFVRDVNDNGLASATAIDILGSSDVQVTKRGLEFRGGHLKVEKLLGHRRLEFIGFLKEEEERAKHGQHQEFPWIVP